MSDIVPLPGGSMPPAPAPQNGGAYPAAYGHGGAPSGATDEGMKRYVAALLRHKWLILTLGILGGVAGYVVTRFQSPIYRVGAQIWMQPVIGGPTAPIRSGQLLSDMGWTDLIKSPVVLDSVIREHQLYLNLSQAADSVWFEAFSLKNQFAPGKFTLARAADGSGYELSDASGQVADRAPVGSPIGEDLGFNWTPPPGAASRSPVEFEVQTPVDVQSELLSNLIAGLPEESQFMQVRLTGTDPERIAATLSGIIERFEEIATQLKKAQLTEQKNILEEQLAVAASNLAEEESLLKNFEVSTATMPREYVVPMTTGGTVQQNSEFQNYYALTAQRQQLQRDRQSILDALEGTAIDVITAMEMIPSARQSSMLAQALEAAANEQANLRALRTQFTDQYPSVRAAQRNLDSLKTAVIPRLAAEVLVTLRNQEADINRQLESAEGSLREIPQRQSIQTQLQRNAAIADDLYRELQTRLENARLAEATAVPDMMVLSRPSVPQVPVQNPRPRMFLMLLAGGFGLGVALAILRDRFDPRVRYPTQITGGLGLNILGAVPALRRGRVGSTDMALAVESFRSIQLSLVHAHGMQSPMAITFTSPGASDGKSFVTSNLAIAFADMGHRTLVVDGDVRRGSMHQLLGGRHKPGLTDHLAGRTPLAEVVQTTRYPLLDLIGCGSRSESGPKLLGSPGMAQLMERLRGDYDVILVDSPPLGACVDPMILGTLTRNLVLIVRTGATDRGMAESKLDTLDRLPVRVLGAIMNDVSASGPYRYYSYVSGYEVIEDLGEGREVNALGEGSESED